MRQGCDRLLVFPLYPQYAAATTATANDKVFDALKTLRAQPALRTVPPYPEDPVYIAALAHSIRTHLAALDFEPEAILASFHGVPQDYIDKGDPYQGSNASRPRRSAPRSGRFGAKLKLTFQSRFGRAEWIKPYTDQDGEALARTGSSASPSSRRLRRRLHRDARRDRRGEQGNLPRAWRRELRLHSLPQRQRGRYQLLVHLIERELEGWV